MQGELVQTKTSDDVTLHGVFLPAAQPRTDLAVDAMLFLHGSAGNFYGTPSSPRADEFRAAGIPTALFNTRGHDVIAGHSGGKKVGNAYEILDECRFDVDAMVGWMAGRGFRRVGLFGSSLAGTKVVYYQATTQDRRVGAVVSLSPLRLSHAYFAQSSLAADHLRFVEQAKALVDAGTPDALVEVTFPISSYFSAAVYLDRHGAERYNICDDFTHKVNCPLLVLGGTEEKHPRMLDCVGDMLALAQRQGNTLVDGEIVEGGNHGLQGMERYVQDRVIGWLERVGAPVQAR